MNLGTETMSNAKSRNTLTVLFGFGGSGGKTIASLAELLTTDPNAAEFARERIHVVLCDTDEGDLRKNREAIRRAFADRCPGLEMQVENFSLSTNVDAFSDLVEARMGDGAISSIDGRTRIRDAWWFDDEGVPFSAERLPLPPNAGAGQCPLVSHFLSWDKLEEFPRVLDRINEHALNKRHMEDYSVELIMVGSLAGGTGRGCWQLLSLKAREYFGQMGQSCRPIGFFMDQAVFKDVQRNRPEQEVKLKVNSLTGLSELAMWLRSDRRFPDATSRAGEPRERRFSLPNLRKPDSPESDVIDTDRYMPESERARVGRSPIHKAYVFSDKSSSMEVTSADQVYEVCSAAIYGRLMIGQMRSDDANQPSRAAATATSVLQVPVTDIRQVVQAKAKAERCKMILLGGAGRTPMVSVNRGGRSGARLSFEVADQAARLRIDALLQRVERFLEVHRSAGRASSSSNESPHAEYLARRWGPASRDDLRNDFGEAFRTGDLDEFQALLEQGGTSAVALRSALKPCFKKVLELSDGESEAVFDESDEGGNGFAKRIAMAALDRLVVNWRDADSRLPRMGTGPDGCMGLALVAIQELHSKLEGVSDALREAIADVGREGSSGGGDQQAVGAFNRLRRWWAIWPLPKFGEGSRESILSEVENARIAGERLAAMQEFKQIADEMREVVGEWLENAGAVAEVLHREEQRQLRSSQERREKCFTMVDARNPRKTAVDALTGLQDDELNPVHKARRRLRPIYDEEMFDELVRATLDEKGGVALAQAEFSDTLMGVGELDDQERPRVTEASVLWWNGRKRRGSDRHRFKQGVARSLEEILAKQATPDTALRQFAIDEVLDRLVEFWCELYESNAGDEKFERQLATAVENLCGIDLRRLAKEQRDDESRIGAGRIEPPDLAEILSSAALKLADKCDPLIGTMNEKEASGDLVSVLLPDTSFGNSTRPHEAWQARLEDKWKLEPHKFAFVKCGLNTDNPYMIVASSDHPKRDFDDVGWDGWVCFDYWQRAFLQDWLVMVEDPAGASVFERSKDDSIGLGYLDPRMVRTEHWAKRRWRPWFDPSKEKSQDRRKWEAIAYAFLGNEVCEANGTPASSDRQPFLAKYRQFVELVNGRIVANEDYRDEQWSLPLIEEKFGDRDVPQFLRPLFRKTPDGYRRATARPVAKFTSAIRFVEWFNSDDSREILDRIWQEQVLFAKFLDETANSTQDVASGLHAVMSRDHRNDIRLAMKEYVGRWLRIIEDGTEREDDKEKKAVFLRDFERVFSDPTFDILRPFDTAAPSS